MESLKYFINDSEYSGFELVKLAFDFGYRHKPETVANLCGAIINAVRFLRDKKVNVRIIDTDGTDITDPDVVVKDSDANLKLIDYKPDEMIVLFDDGVYRVDPVFLSDECWDIQLFGNPGCAQCPDKNKVSCYGEDVIKNGVNMYGSEIPLAIKLGNRPKREAKK